MRDKPWFSVVYMFAVMAVFSSVLVGFARLTRGRVEQNEQIAVERAVLAVLPAGVTEETSNEEAHRIFLERVSGPASRYGGAYVFMEAGAVLGYAVPIAGRGFWAPIKGFVGVGVDKRSLRGLAFYEQAETPGLGAEIVKPAFTSQFAEAAGLVMALSGEPVGIVRAGSAVQENEVAAVTGATQTSRRLEKLINEDLAAWRESMLGNGEVMK